MKLPSKERWGEICEVFDKLETLEGQEIESFLLSLRKNDLNLFKEVIAFLENEKSLTEVLGGSFEDKANTSLLGISIESLSQDLVTLKPGDMVGSYQVIELIGLGGMGSVFLAERSAPFTQKVALKVIHPGSFNSDLVRRFEQERQILADVNHVNIASIIDGGTTNEGLPYYAMEYIVGKPIDEYCEENNLDLDRRLSLFADLCNAVDYLHKHLIVHSDLKPSNILVTEAGVVKILDFGISNVIRSPSMISVPDQKKSSIRLLTPTYAAPEQITKGNISVATDVYQLGLILYKLLTGSNAHRIENLEVASWKSNILESAPQRPSTVVIISSTSNEKSKWIVKLESDIDFIVLKMLGKNPEDRYSSAKEIVRDIDRFWKNEELDARPPSARYRITKYTRRNRVPLTIFFLVLLGVIALAFQSSQIANERDNAEKQARRVEIVKDALEDIMTVVDAYDEEVNYSDTSAIRKVGNLILISAIEKSSSLTNEPDIKAELEITIGRILTSYGFFNQAIDLVSNTVELGDKVDEYILHDALSTLGELLIEMGDYDKADQVIEDLLDLSYSIYEEPNEGIARALHLSAWHTYASGKYEGRLEEPINIFKQALNMRLLLNGDYSTQIATNKHDLGVALDAAGLHHEAEEMLRDVLRIRQEYYGNDHPLTVSAINTLGDILGNQDDFSEAVDFLTMALEVRILKLGENHPKVALNMNNLATLLHRMGDPTSAKEYYLRVINIYEELNSSHENLALAKMNYGNAVCAEYDPRGSTIIKDNLSFLENGPYASHWIVSASRGVLGQCLLDLNNYEEAEKYILQSYNELLEKKESKEDRYIQQNVERLIRLYSEWGKEDKKLFYQDQLYTARG